MSPCVVSDTICSTAGLNDQRLALLDIGGYFARSADALNAELDGSLVGITEGTENGAQRYDTSPPATVPVITVARSPLKLPRITLSALVWSSRSKPYCANRPRFYSRDARA